MSTEAHLRFACFGGQVGVHVGDSDREGPEELAADVRTLLLDAHQRLSRFDPESELSRLNRDRREAVPASPLLRRVAAAVSVAGAASEGLVDATLLGAIERAGYAGHLEPLESPAPQPLPDGGERRPAGPSAAADWRSVAVDEEARVVIRPPGVRIDPGGIAKGLLADVAAERLRDCRTFAVDCCGDIRLGGRGGAERRVGVDGPFGEGILHEFALAEGAIATSGISRRAWVGPGSEPAHQILDPRRGRPAFTGVVQATALAPSALEAEVLAKSALLSGPDGAARWLPFGGLVVLDGGVAEEIPARLPLAQAAMV